ncbi:MAG TPA: MBL fold metallo-hydrolase [Candidatus Omnitrophota bacterium]|nr:MBL fold metallo-hydrolase [Candidatus Omnitrophota bacterium]HPD85421.1 MBL fold metallo-hydrolase [Candidatus Omnitrophota bacterium]HRZ04078.1 MBL fold metallo-hydrolase [Candidatus Omnitrophota bacterium]
MPEKPPLLLEQIEIGPMGNFAYFLGDKKTGEIAVVDPAWDADFILNEAGRKKLTLKAVLLTHGHFDHTNAIDGLLKTKDIPVYISEGEAEFQTPDCPNLKKIKDHEMIKIGNIEIRCLHTPGHTPGCQCFLAEGNLLTGDTLFIDSIGRCDLPEGDVKAMYHSLYNVIMKLPDTTVIYPGHQYGPVSSATLGEQKKTNPYLQCRSFEEFSA